MTDRPRAIQHARAHAAAAAVAAGRASLRRRLRLLCVGSRRTDVRAGRAPSDELALDGRVCNRDRPL